MSSIVRFDDSLPLFAKLIVDELGLNTLQSGVVLRDVIGRLAFFSSVQIDQLAIDRISSSLRAQLGNYARTDRTLASVDDFGVESILSDSSALRVLVGDYSVRLIDRRIAGADWLRYPMPPAGPPPRFVFSSLKGGVGRSTALSVTAAHLAAQGRRVLVIDLDMEAPGLGAILLDEGTTPEFGIVDALVENNLTTLDDGFFADLVGPSRLADRRGRIDVVPAYGSRSIRNPGDILAKLARAYAEDVRADGSIATILDQVQEIVQYFSDSLRYEAILIDARAGLHETTASAILGLGAEVYLFGLDDAQTFHGYSALLAHLARFVDCKKTLPEWLDRLTMVQGKAPADADSRAAFAEKCRTLFIAAGLTRESRESEVVAMAAEPFNDIPWDDNSDVSVIEETSKDRQPLAIMHDERYQNFDPMQRRDLVTQQLYENSYGAFLKRVDEAFSSETQDV